MILAIGGSRESMHDFRSFVGIRSREHVEFDEDRIALRTSRVVAGKNRNVEEEQRSEED